MRIESREILKRGSFPLSGIKVLAFAFLGVASSTALARAQQTPSPPAAPQPVIPEDEFEQAVPPLDPELDRPLESLDAFKQEQRGGDQEDEVAAPPTMVQGGDAGVDIIGNAPPTDPALQEPLPPLSSFQIEPVEIPEEENASEKTTIAYDYRVDGLENAKAEDADMAGLFKDESALEDGDGEAANAAMVSARMTEDQELLRHILESEGFYDASFQSRLEQPNGDNDRLTAILKVVPGQRYAIGDIVIQAKPTTPSSLIRDNLNLSTGDPIIAARVLAAEANVKLVMPQQGYPFAEVGQRDILLDSQAGTGDYTLPVETGPRSRFGGFTTTGDLVFAPEHIDVLARFKRGELYDSRKVDDLRQALVATGLFSTISVEPKQTGEEAPDDTEYVNLLVRQQAGPPRTLAATAGYSTGQGFRVEGSWTHRNLFPPEGALIVSGVGGTQEQGAGVTFRRSNAGRRDRTVELSVNGLHSNYDAFEAFTGRIAGRISYDSTPIWQKRFTYAYGFELIGTSEDDYDFASGKRQRQTYWIASLPLEAGFDTSDDLLNPTSGFRLTAHISPEISFGRGTNPYARSMIEGSAYYPATEDIVLAGRVRVASIAGADRTDIAPSRRLYGGGGGSVRGFGYQELGPKDPNGDPIGGRSLNEAAAEVRYRFGNFGIVGFVDAGQVYESSTPKFSDWRFGAGIGGRFYTNFGPLRLDVATPIGRRKGESRIAIYVSIGQAF